MDASLRIAVADDEPYMREYFQVMLPRLGHRVVAAAANGRQLVTACAAHAPDLVITDLNMPELDGLEAAQQIFAHRPLPVILVSACHDLERIGRSVGAHVLGHLVKPIKRTDLEPAIVLAVERFAQFERLQRGVAKLPARTNDLPENR